MVIWKFLAEFKSFVDLGNTQLVHWPLGVHASTWVLVPVPSSAQVTPGLKDFDIESELTDPVKHGNAGESSPDDDGVCLE